MNKIATYLNQHLLGEAASSKTVRKRFSRDGSILTITPELVVFPRVTNDIRKTARFTWQLAEKGHTMGVTIRGAGADTTGGAIGKGLIIDTSAHLNSILTLAIKDRLVHVQSGTLLSTLEESLKWQGMTLLNLPDDTCHTTIGGAIASNTFGARGPIADAIEKLEVVLANGDVIETGRVSRHEVNKKLGLQTFEGEIYRKLSALLEDNEALIETLAKDLTIDSTGYKAIASIKQKDGSFDLTPLFIGSQGTLGFISETVLRTEFYSASTTAALVILDSSEVARDFAERVVELNPGKLLTIDGQLLNRGAKQGKSFALIGDQTLTGTAVVIVFDDINDRAQRHKLKKLRKVVNKMNLPLIDSTDHDSNEFAQLFDIQGTLARIADDEQVSLPILDGAFVPADRREEFANLIDELATKQHVSMPGVTNVLTGTVTYYPDLSLHSVSDKQKLFRLLNEYATTVHKCNGAVTSDGAEGRVKAIASWSVLEDAEVKLYEEVRAIFDPFGTLNPGVKQKAEVRTLVSQLRTSYDTTDFLA
jgi:FAD/FMN-containing dehydrogenase